MPASCRRCPREGCFGSPAAIASATADFCSSIRRRSSKAHEHPSGGTLGRTVREVRRQDPERRDEHPCACSCRTDSPPQPCRIAHSRPLRYGPTTCQTHEPVQLEILTRHHVRFAVVLRTAHRSLQQAARSPKADVQEAKGTQAIGVAIALPLLLASEGRFTLLDEGANAFLAVDACRRIDNHSRLALHL
jgi:hypothetical protein